MAVVTVSRLYGAGGLRVARAIAEALGFTLVDRELVEQAAARLGIDPAVASSRDEQVPALIEELGQALAAASPELALAPPAEMNDQVLATAVREAILSMATAGGYVILGRGAQAALADRDDVCSLMLIADEPDRVRWIMGWQGIDEREAKARLDRVDAERAAYVRRFYGVDIRDPSLYDAVINTSRLGLDRATQVATGAARSKVGRA